MPPLNPQVAIDISSESQRLLSTVDLAELQRRAQRATHLADSALSRAAANVTRSHLADKGRWFVCWENPKKGMMTLG